MGCWLLGEIERLRNTPAPGFIPVQFCQPHRDVQPARCRLDEIRHAFPHTTDDFPGGTQRPRRAVLLNDHLNHSAKPLMTEQRYQRQGGVEPEAIPV